jgi:hypothetical protein
MSPNLMQERNATGPAKKTSMTPSQLAANKKIAEADLKQKEAERLAMEKDRQEKAAKIIPPMETKGWFSENKKKLFIIGGAIVGVGLIVLIIKKYR